MRNNPAIFFLMIILSLALNSCGPSTAPTDTTVEPTPTFESSAQTPATPTLISIPKGKTIVVLSTADSGTGTLRQALTDAHSGDIIIFDYDVFPPSAQATIYLTSGLPPITQANLTLDASNARVILDGSNILNDWTPGLEIHSDENTIWGLQIVNFSGAGIVLSGGAQYNTIGGDRSIGSGPLGQVNLMSGNNMGIGLWDERTSYNTITGNLIGTYVDGVTARGNRGTGVYIAEGASRNTIGPHNIIAYNSEEGIQIYNSNSIGNTITQNSIHDNGILSIYLNDGGNANLPPPLIINFDLADGTITGSSCANCTIEIFSDSNDSGAVFEGQAIVDSDGAFTFNKGTSFIGPHLTATVTARDGNTSEFSRPTSGTDISIVLQEENHLPITQLETKRSSELIDNRIGDFPELQNLDARIENLLNTGFKWQKVEILKDGKYNGIFWEVDWHTEEYSVDPEYNDAITELANSGVSLVACLGCLPDESGSAERGRFRTEQEIQQYLSYVRKVVSHFKGRIQYYEIWNEPNVQTPNWYVELPDYINLIARTIPVILEEYPEAKIVVGSTTPPNNPNTREYLYGVLRSDIMPLVDVVSWHPMYGTSPEHDCCRDYYYEYPSIVQEIKEVASAHGFGGEYYAAEINWVTTENPLPPVLGQPRHSEIISAKYYARGIVMHLGMDVMAGIISWGDNPTEEDVTQNLCTIMAGAKPVSLPVAIQSKATNIIYYSFSLPDGGSLIALWTDGVAVEDALGIQATITIHGFSSKKVVGIDILSGFEQQMITAIEDGNLSIRDLIVKDYPIMLLLTDQMSP